MKLEESGLEKKMISRNTTLKSTDSVSYTHLDVYKRQIKNTVTNSWSYF